MNGAKKDSDKTKIALSLIEQTDCTILFKQAVRIALVDSDPNTHAIVRTVINQKSKLWTINGYFDVDQGLSNIITVAPDVLLLDIGASGRCGADYVRRLKALLPDLHIIIFLDQFENHQIFELLKAGVCGGLFKRFVHTTLVQAVSQALQGWLFLCPSSSKAFKSFLGNAEKFDLRTKLTRRQRQVLKFLSENLTDKEIAQALGVSMSTVHGHTAALFKKLGVHSRDEACRDIQQY